jgi:hypothetical protein
MDIFPLTIFPDGGLASSVITTVWVGVFVLCFFNLRFGWVLSGLVVPGYLVPLVIVKPVAAAVIVVEAILTYALVWVFSEKLSRGRFPALFGRDRFMGLILASIAVRLSFDGYLLPMLADWLLENFDRRFDWSDNLQSFGLVIISLLANQFWKPGLGRGLVAAAVTIGLTFLIVRYGLMELTNFRMSGVSYLYEGLASSILASPKAYIILVLTAMLASQVNVRYGWDFSGILIPALIALQWYQPTKVLTSFLEAIVIYFLARLILRLPMLANATIEGGRKLLLFFNISFAWKMLVGWVIVWWGFDVKTTDFYGFGYLLSTLIAIKAHDKNIFPRLARSTLQVSLSGAVLGNLIGFGLSAVVSRAQSLPVEETDDAAAPGQTPRLDALVVRAIGDAWVRKVRGASQPLSEPATETFRDLVELFEAGIPGSSPTFELTASDWRVQRVEGGRFAIIRADGLGEELLVYNPQAQRELAIIVHDPTEAPGLGMAGLQLQRSQDARWLVIAAPAGTTEISGNPVVETFRQTSRMALLAVTGARSDIASRAVFANRAASLIDLAALQRAIPGLDVSLQPQPDEVTGNEGLIALDPPALAALARLAFAPDPPATAVPTCGTPSAGNVSKGWSELSQLAFLRYEIAAPMLSGLEGTTAPEIARASARLGGFTLDQCRLGTKLQWRLFAVYRDEGYAFFAQGEVPQKLVLSYRDPLTPFAARAGAAIAREWEADALLIAPEADSLFRSPMTAFDVVWQELLRTKPPAEGVSVFQLRQAPLSSLRYRGAAEIVVARDVLGSEDMDYLPLVSAIRAAGLRSELAGTDRSWAGFERRPSTALRYLDQVVPRRYAVGWVLVEPPAPVPAPPPAMNDPALRR